MFGSQSSERVSTAKDSSARSGSSGDGSTSRAASPTSCGLASRDGMRRLRGSALPRKSHGPAGRPVIASGCCQAPQRLLNDVLCTLPFAVHQVDGVTQQRRSVLRIECPDQVFVGRVCREFLAPALPRPPMSITTYRPARRFNSVPFRPALPATVSPRRAPPSVSSAAGERGQHLDHVSVGQHDRVRGSPTDRAPVDQERGPVQNGPELGSAVNPAAAVRAVASVSAVSCCSATPAASFAAAQ